MKEKNIYKTISKYDTIVIARHIGPDPDALASQLALRDSIRLTFPKKKVYAIGAGVSKFKYIGLLDKTEEFGPDALLIVVDLPNISRLDGTKIELFKEVIKIDHHPFIDKMGKLELIDENASSACEVIANLIFNTKLKMNEKIAEQLYIGITTDSNRFLIPSTNYKTFELVSKLTREYKLNLNDIYNNIYERPLNEHRFQAFLLLNLTITENGFAYLKITDEMIEEYGVDSSTASNLVNNFNYIKEVLAWAFVSYDKQTEIYKLNLRSRGPVINDIAAKYDGGGHKYAAGARIRKQEDIDNLLKELDEACKNYQNQDNL